MDSLCEVFLEQDWDDAQQARQKRDLRVVELEGQGWQCTVGLFYNALTGNRIYLVEATSPPPRSSEPTQHPSRHRSQSRHPQRAMPTKPGSASSENR
ncbi:hypothetical protein H6F89_32980 [Cyanobacteria bacterium FACHB-63]|nr:hypothetical protein [Cyanobacteria bacterium FACHB-63]